LYLLALLFGWASPVTLMLIALAAYASYVINAGQFLMKLRMARRDASASAAVAPDGQGVPS
jgi:3-vinyl bacteriochlorophyllide hydratase